MLRFSVESVLRIEAVWIEHSVGWGCQSEGNKRGPVGKTSSEASRHRCGLGRKTVKSILDSTLSCPAMSDVTQILNAKLISQPNTAESSERVRSRQVTSTAAKR